jgi:anti-sigma-K factor RskA
MTDRREHSWYEELAPAFGLGALDDSDRQELEKHLAACPACRACSSEYTQLADDLLYAVPVLETRPGLTEDLKKRIRATAAPRSRTGWLGFVRRPGFALGLAALALLVVTNIYWAGRAGRAEQELSALSALTQGSGIVLDPAATDSHASGVVYTQPQENLALLCVYDLPMLDAGQTYQAWLVRGDKRVSGGTFRVDESGYGVLLVQSDAPLGEFDGLGITVEPAGGSVAPTSPRVMGGDL